MTKLAVLGVLVFLLAFYAPRAFAAQRAAASWAELFDEVASVPSLEVARTGLLARARKVVEQPIIIRPDSLEEVGRHRTWLDGRSRALEDEIRETFALAMADFSACSTLAGELPLLAAAYRMTGDAVFCDRVIRQLKEMAAWSPLQRPGWTLYAPGHRLPTDGKDGNWLATGCGVRALGDTLDLLPDGTVNDVLLDRIHDLLEAEIAGVVDDWETKRPWFVRANNPITNQWVLPTEGLVRACLILGMDGHRDAYELGVKNLLRALDAHGAKGEFEEGVGYASFTVTSLLHTAHAMAVAGDRRAIDHPFLKNFPTWLVHHLQPGDMLINCFDAGAAHGATARLRPLLSLLAACTASPVARWALAEQVGGPSDDLAGLAAGALPPVGRQAAPPLYAYYERATRVNWRDSWADDATGVWVRGGHSLDQHDHQDRGHVNFIAAGRPILIEAGTPSYHHKLMMTHYTTGVGHNVLQLGTDFPDREANAGEHVWYPGWQKRGGVAPITVRRLDAGGGEVVVDGTACYDGLERWHRTVTWRPDELVVTDEVDLANGGEEVILFRWHLGAEEDVSIQGGDTCWTAAWPHAAIRLEATAPVLVSQSRMPDNTLAGHTGDEDPGNEHTCLVVRSRDRLSTLGLTTRVVPK